MNTRRRFIAAGMAGAGSLVVGTQLVAQDKESEKPKPIDKKLVSKFVGRSHGDFDTVKALVKEHPAIVNATWDWGNGDFETGLGAASHVGRRDIAEFLLEKGARLDVFAATMLGIKPMLVAALKTFPKIHATPGPHGIPMLCHAIFGKERADEVFNLLINSNADVNQRSNNGMTPLMAAAMVGRVSTVKILLDKNADPTQANAKGETALSIATKRENRKTAKLIETALKKGM